MTDSSPTEDIKAKMREALEKKNSRERGVHEDAPLQEKAHGSEIADKNVGTQMHRRKAGGGGS